MTRNTRAFAINGAPLRAAAFAAAALMLAACGGGGSATTGGPGTPPVTPTPPVTQTPSAPEETPLDRLGALRERADMLAMTGLHARWSLSAEGEDDIDDAFVGGVTCSGARCAAADGTALAARDRKRLKHGVRHLC